MIDPVDVNVIIPWWGETTDTWRLRSLDFVLEMWKSFGMKVIIGRDDSPVFNLSHARNVGVGESTSELVILADADVVISESQIRTALDIVSKSETWVIPYDVYFNLTMGDTENVLNKTKDPADCEWDHCILSWAGLAVLKREVYSNFGGHDERFVGWGEEDVAFRLKLDHEYAAHKRVQGNIYHLWHPVSNETTFGSPEYVLNRELLNGEYRAKYGWVDERLSWS